MLKRILFSCGLVVFACSVSIGQTFTVDAGQLDVFGGAPPADDILFPAIFVGAPPAPALIGGGAGVPGIDVDGFSFGLPTDPTRSPLLFSFSVDAASAGIAGTAVGAESAVAEAHTDVFSSFGGGGNIQVFDGDGIPAALPASPALGLGEPGIMGSILGVDGYDDTPTQRPAIYWSVDPATVAPAAPYAGLSAADVFLAPAVAGYDVPPVAPWAAAPALGLVPMDNIDALEVYDGGTPGVFDPLDVILFSLAPGSPSLPGLGAGAGDVLISAGGAAAPFAPAAALGLAGGDNLNALSVTAIPEPGVLSLLTLSTAGAFCQRRKR